MRTFPANRTRTLLVSFESGDDVIAEVDRVLSQAQIRCGYLQGHGISESTELSIKIPLGGDSSVMERASGRGAISISGSIAIEDGRPKARLSGILSRESGTIAGELLQCTAHAIECLFIVVDDPVLQRRGTGETGARVFSEQLSQAGLANVTLDTPAKPIMRKLERTTEDLVYPDEGDKATHFHFGECSVVSSDGDRIRLRQEKDGRIREVSLSMLKVEPPTFDENTNTRHFHLARKV